jgi:hypothetical protein
LCVAGILFTYYYMRVRRSLQDSKNATKRRLIMWGGIVSLIIPTDRRWCGQQYRRLGDNTMGGSVGAQIIGALLGHSVGAAAAGTGGLDIGSIIGQIASGGVGGGILMVIVGLIKQAMGGQRAA